jgi:gluconolactonase
VELVHPILTPNGIALSPDGRTLYVAETDTARLWAWPIEAPGVLRNAPFPSPQGGRLVAGLGGFQRLDSMAVEAAGNICVATLINGGITVISPQRGFVRHVALPDVFCTNICFGGPQMRTAYITLAASGRLIAMEWPEPGLRLAHEA